MEVISFGTGIILGFCVILFGIWVSMSVQLSDEIKNKDNKD